MVFGGIVFLVCLFGCNFVYFYCLDVDECDYDFNGDFWKRYC